MAADLAEHGLRGVLEPWRLRFERGGGEEARRHAELLRGFEHGRLVGLQVDRGDERDCGFGKSRFGERAAQKRDRLARIGATLAADADGETARMEDECLRVPLGRASRRDEADCAVRVERNAAFGEPRRVAFEPRRRSGEKRGHHRLRVVRVRKRPAFRRRVERDAETIVAGGGDRRMAAERFGEAAGKVVCAAMAAEKRHDRGAVLGDGDDRRLLALVGKERRQDADQDSGGADADDGPAFEKECADLSGGVRSRQNFAAYCLGGAARGRDAGIGQRDEDRLHARSLAIRIIEKYGASSASRSASGSIRSSSREAWAT